MRSCRYALGNILLMCKACVLEPSAPCFGCAFTQGHSINVFCACLSRVCSHNSLPVCLYSATVKATAPEACSQCPDNTIPAHVRAR